MKNEKQNLWLIPEHFLIEDPIPLSAFLFKISSRCNLDCDYCYVYHSADQSWKSKPKFITEEIIDQSLYRIFEHVKFHKLKLITIILHGGEPLLAGLKIIEYIFSRATELSKGVCKLELGMQTNGILIDNDTIALFNQYNAEIGISIDGNKNANDRHRFYSNKKSSFNKVKKAIDLLKENDLNKKIFAGLLTVIDLENDPIETYKYLINHKPRQIDFLLPDSTHDSYPNGKSSFTHTPYADWLIKIFDIWFYDDDSRTRIKYFSNIISLLIGGKSETESIGLSPVNFIIIETNGELEAVDTLKVAYDGAPSLGRNVFNSSFDEIIRYPAILTRMQGKKSVAMECQLCPLVEICGGGYIPHRYSNERGFNNPSVYCHDIAKLIIHIRSKIKGTIK